MKEFVSRCYVYYAPQDVRVEEKNITCGPTDIVLKVLASARCGTDKTVYREGHYKVDPHAPIVLGHELVGEVAAVGEEVHKLTNGIGYMEGRKIPHKYLDFKPGEKVTTQSRIARYSNGLMLLDDPITILSFYIDGGYSQYMKVPKELIQSASLIRVPDTITAEEGALVEPAACALESIFQTPHPDGLSDDGRPVFKSGIKKGGRACVIGSGTVSMIYAQLCKVEGAAEVHMIVRSKAKAELAASILGSWIKTIVFEQPEGGTLQQMEAAEDKIVEELKDRTRNCLFDDVIAACPDVNAQRLMLRLYSPQGYAVGACFGGTHRRVDDAEMDLHHYRTAKTIGTSGCSTAAMEKIASWITEGKLSLRGFTSPVRYTFETPPREFFTTASGGLKPVLYPWE